MSSFHAVDFFESYFSGGDNRQKNPSDKWQMVLKNNLIQNMENTKKQGCQSRIIGINNLIFSGEKGIRTPERLVAFTHFPGVLLRPLGHLSLVNQPT